MGNLKMKKLLEQDKKTRKNIKKLEKKKLILKIISNNSNLPDLVRFNALTHSNTISVSASKTFISNRCVLTVGKKKFNKLTHFSRIVFLKLARHQNIYGLTKASW